VIGNCSANYQSPVTNYRFTIKSFSITVPASSANLGAGFDCLALALELRNRIEVSEAEEGSGVALTVEGEGAATLPRDGRSLLLRAMERVFQEVGRRPAGRLNVRAANGIPLGSGMGSSAATIVGGLAAANALVDGGLDKGALLRLAHAIEGHPDNVAAAVYGGLVLVSADGEALQAQALAVPPMQVVIVLPAMRLPTAQARAALPAQVPLKDAVFNLGHALFTVQALQRGDEALLRWAVADRLHQPYRQKLIPGFAAVEAAARDAGASAVALSGAGPSLIAFATSGHDAIAAAMQAAFQARGLTSRAFVLPVTPRGVEVMRS
jgi:homoserine kinase